MNSQVAYYVSRALDVNYAALALAVYGGGDISPDYAVAQIQSRSTSDRARKTAQTLEMVRLAERGYSYMTIARMMGLNGSSTVWRRVKNWRDKHESDI